MRGCAWPVAWLGAVSVHCAPEAAARTAASGITVPVGAQRELHCHSRLPTVAACPATVGTVRLPARMR